VKSCLSIDLDDYGDYARLLSLPADATRRSLYGDGIPHLLDVLDRHELRATFFAIGRDAASRDKSPLLRELVARGHEVANHSFDHPYDFRKLARAEKRRQILDADAAIADAVGMRPRGFRAPSFSVDGVTLELLEEAGYAYDSSLVPSPVLWGMQVYAACFVRRARYDLGSPAGVLAPSTPYAPRRGGAVWERARSPADALHLLEIPCSVTPLLRVPLYGTVLRTLGSRARARCLARRRGEGAVAHALFHLLDVADPSDTPLAGALGRLPALWPSAERRRATFAQAVELLASGGRSCTLAELAASGLARSETTPRPDVASAGAPPVAPAAAAVLSVVIPAHDAARTLGRTLDAVLASAVPGGVEVVVVDDGSRDDTARVAGRPGVLVERLRERCGAARARNAGAALAHGRFLVFLDADVVPASGALAALAASVERGRDCVIGRYGPECLASSFGARFKNAVHCALFDASPGEVSWFWTGLGAVRRTLFLELGGFDEQRFGRRAGLEDLDLGIRLRARGVTIHLARDVVVAHDHPRSAWQVLRNDFARAEQQAALALDRAHYADEAFATPGNFARVVALDAALVLLVLAAVLPTAVPGLFALAAFALLSRPVYRAFLRHGACFALRAAVLDVATVVAAQLGALAAILRSCASRRRRARGRR